MGSGLVRLSVYCLVLRIGLSLCVMLMMVWLGWVSCLIRVVLRLCELLVMM